MKIIGKGKDYYDSALRLGRDTTLRFIRTNAVYLESARDDVVFAEHSFMFSGVPGNCSVRRARYGRLTFSPFRVAFCGKMYNGVKVQYWGPDAICDWDSATKVDYFYEPAALEHFVAETEIRLENPQKCESDCVPHLLAFLAAPTPTNHGFFVGNAEAIVLADSGQGYHSRSVTVNPTLSAVAFFKVLDPWQAFQELEMFLGGIAAPENAPPVFIADKDRITQRGFDRMSFRKSPTKRRAA